VIFLKSSRLTLIARDTACGSLTLRLGAGALAEGVTLGVGALTLGAGLQADNTKAIVTKKRVFQIRI
jgi:hypothetical protein